MLLVEKRILSIIGFEALIYDSTLESVELYFIDFFISNNCKIEQLNGFSAFFRKLKETCITASFCLLRIFDSNFCNSHEKTLALIYYSFEQFLITESSNQQESAILLISEWVRKIYIFRLMLSQYRLADSWKLE